MGVIDGQDHANASATGATSAAGSAPHAVCERLAAFVDAELEEMDERIDIGGCDIRIGLQIRCDIEADRRVAALVPSEQLRVQLNQVRQHQVA
jgi:hypothetical protein